MRVLDFALRQLRYSVFGCVGFVFILFGFWGGGAWFFWGFFLWFSLGGFLCAFYWVFIIIIGWGVVWFGVLFL